MSENFILAIVSFQKQLENPHRCKKKWQRRCLSLVAQWSFIFPE
jgi:hypothetical protein